ncbi:MAG: hypothetical protein PHG44_00320 [Lentisphaeria bacterium]|jgi:hypothetical protein|nr:hypothetical protein [Lentisphaeria bacterium]MDY0175751.1 hypothetical protein [Lentisphaeria bacterium]
MARKKQKRKQNSQQPLLFNDPEQLRDNWLQALQGGESRKAFRLMREYFELVPLEAEMLPKAQETLEQRLLQMYQAKEYRQLSELYKATLKRYPSLQGQLQEQFLALLHWQDSDKAYFQKYESDPGVQSQLQAFVRHLMRDPGEILDCGHFQAEHPLHKEASLIMKLWRQIEKGESAALNQLNQSIGRRSPFLAWRLLINGLAYFYDKQSEQANEHLKRIEPASPLHQLAGQLMDLMKQNWQANTKSQQRIKLACTENSFYRQISELDEQLQKGNTEAVKSLLQHIFTAEMAQRSPVLYYGLFGALMHFAKQLPIASKIDEFATLADNPQRLFCTLQHQRLLANLDGWNVYVKAPELSKLERALAWDHLATLYSIRCHQRLHNARYMDTSQKAEMLEDYYDDMEDCWENSCDCFPLAESYNKWQQCAVAVISPAKSDDILLQWSKHFPEDPRPLKLLISSARERKALTKAAGHLRRLTELSPLDPELPMLTQLLAIEQHLQDEKKQTEKKPLQSAGSVSGREKLLLDGFHKSLFPGKKGAAAAEGPLIISSCLESRMFELAYRPEPNDLPKRTLDYEAAAFFNETEALLYFADPVWGQFDLGNLHMPPLRLLNLDAVPSQRIWELCQIFLSHNIRQPIARNCLRNLDQVITQAIGRNDPLLPGFMMSKQHLLQMILEVNYQYSDYIRRKLRLRCSDNLILAYKLCHENNLIAALKNLDAYLKNLNQTKSWLQNRADRLGVKTKEKIFKECSQTEEDSNYANWNAYPPKARKQKKKLPLFIENISFTEEQFDNEYQLPEDEDDFDDNPFFNDEIFLEMIEQLAKKL